MCMPVHAMKSNFVCFKTRIELGFAQKYSWNTIEDLSLKKKVKNCNLRRLFHKYCFKHASEKIKKIFKNFDYNSKVLETWILISSFKYFGVVRIEDIFVCFFFGRSFGVTILFRDLLTFNFWTKFETSAHCDVAYPRENVTKSSIIKKGNDDDMIDWGDSPFWPFLQLSMIQ